MGRFNKTSASFFIGVFLIIGIGTAHSLAQVMGELGEMDRLEQQADDLAAQADPEGATLAIGKAAMMAKIIAQQHDQEPTHTLFESAERLFRGQEHAFRALAIFQQTGEQLPAPIGVCQALTQAEASVAQSHISFTALKNAWPSTAPRQQRYLDQTKVWQAILRDLQDDLDC